jgi:hypothetical protein
MTKNRNVSFGSVQDYEAEGGRGLRGPLTAIGRIFQAAPQPDKAL